MPLITVLVSFVIVTVFGGFLVQRWQQNNWNKQQKFLGHEKEYIALKDLIEELSSLAGARVYHMQRLILGIDVDQKKLQGRFLEYEDISRRWNERLLSFYNRLTIFGENYLTTILETEIQSSFVKNSRLLELMGHGKISGKGVDSNRVQVMVHSLNALNGRIGNFNKRLLNYLEKKRIEVYFGTYVRYERGNLYLFSNRQLVKALFIRDVNRYSILCPALDVTFPARRGD